MKFRPIKYAALLIASILGTTSAFAWQVSYDEASVAKRKSEQAESTTIPAYSENENIEKTLEGDDLEAYLALVEYFENREKFECVEKFLKEALNDPRRLEPSKSTQEALRGLSGLGATLVEIGKPELAFEYNAFYIVHFPEQKNGILGEWINRIIMEEDTYKDRLKSLTPPGCSYDPCENSSNRNEAKTAAIEWQNKGGKLNTKRALGFYQIYSSQSPARACEVLKAIQDIPGFYKSDIEIFYFLCDSEHPQLAAYLTGK